MPVAIDYYAVLGVPRGASKDDVEVAVKKSMREWLKRTEATDLSVRQEAEHKVKWIEEARTTLLEATKRSTYDAQLASGVMKNESPVMTGEQENWLDLAQQYLSQGDYHSAAYAAREATQIDGSKARSWWLRSRSNAGLNRWDDALYEAQQAVTIEGINPDYHFNLGCIAEEMRRWDQAISAFSEASRIDSATPMYQLAVGGVHLQNGLPQKALAIVEPVYAVNPQDETTNYYLGMILIDCAEKVPAVTESDSYAVTSSEEIRIMREYTARASALKIQHDEVRTEVANITTYLDRMEKKAFRWPTTLLGSAVEAAEGTGFLGGALAVIITGGIMLLPVILVLSGFGMLASGGNVGSGFLTVLVGLALGYLWFRLTWIPRWKHNKKDLA